MSKAGAEFSQAFERLKSGAPVNVPEGTPVSQNNVAREAGRDPSALKKSRHPQLIQDIQNFLANKSLGRETSTAVEHDNLPISSMQYQKALTQIEDLRSERDILLSKLLVAHERIIILTASLEPDT